MQAEMMAVMKTKTNFSLIRVYLFLALGLLFGACAEKSQKSQELTFWAMGAEGENIGPIVRLFEAEHPEIKIKVQSIPWGAAHEKLLTAFAGQSTPDLCQLGNTWIPEFQAIEALLPLDSLLAGSTIIRREDFFTGIWNTNVIGTQLLGIPWYVDTRLLFYRKDILARAGYDQPPATWQEWLDLCRKIKMRASPSEYAMFFSLIFNDWTVPVILILANGGPLLKDNNCYGAFDDPATFEALRFYLSFFENGLAPKTMSEATNIYQGFTSGYFAMMITGPWNVNEIRKRAPELAGQWSTAPMPTQQYNYSTAGGASLVIFKKARNPRAAWLFIEYLSRAETQMEFFKLTRDLPAVKKAWEMPEIIADPEMKAFYQQLENVVPTPKIAEWEQIAVKIQEHLETVILGGKTLETAVRNLNRDTDKILEKRRWLIQQNQIQF